MSDAELLLASARRPLVLGIGGGGDVVGGVTWERRVIDPEPGPRRADQIDGARELAPGVLAASSTTRVRDSGVRFAEARVAELLGGQTLLVDVTRPPALLAASLGAVGDELGVDLFVFVDVGGDALAHGDEDGLASPLCDAIMLAAAAHLGRGRPVLAGIFGTGCDGELTPDEVLERVAEVAAAGGLAGVRGLTLPVVERLERAVEAVPTEASAQALRCYRGELGTAAIRSGRRTVRLSPLGATTIYFDPAAAVASAARLARAVMDSGGIENANERLHALGLRTELDYERAFDDR